MCLGSLDKGLVWLGVLDDGCKVGQMMDVGCSVSGTYGKMRRKRFYGCLGTF